MRQHDSLITRLPDGADITAARPADHALIQQLIIETLLIPQDEDFQSRLDDPGYHASDRLLVRLGDRVTAHVHVSSHVAIFGGERMPLVWLENFVARPEHEHAGHDEALVRAAEATACREGAVLALTATPRWQWFESRGWSTIRSQGHTRANVRATLSHLEATEPSRRRRRRRKAAVRTWRHVDLDQLRHVYDLATADGWGPLCRTERIWQWLIGRKAHDQILLATEQGDAESAKGDRVVGYAVVRNSCVVEMFTLPGRTSVRTMLLAAACRDAIDRDHHFITLYTPADDPLHELMVTAGGGWIGDGASGGQRWMIKLLSPQQWLERLYPVLQSRARQSDISRPWNAMFRVEDQNYALTLTRRSARLESIDEAKREANAYSWTAFQNLLLGNFSGADAAPPEAADSMPLNDLESIFPSQLFWQSPLEMIRL